MEQYAKIANDVENGFVEPSYLNQQIRYVTDKESADVWVSAQHTLGDYLVIGIVALQHSIEEKSGDILVYEEVSPTLETIGMAKGIHSPLHKIQVNSGLFLQTHTPAEAIYQKLYEGELRVSGIGLSIAMLLTIQFSTANEGIPEEIMSNLVFTYFDDLETAQKNAFFLIKKMAGSSVAGSYYAMVNSED